jgi:NADPH2:quinone reductase
MKAAVYYHTGGPEVFGYEDVPDPTVPADGVLVRVQAISIEGGDTLHRARDGVNATPHVVPVRQQVLPAV